MKKRVSWWVLVLLGVAAYAIALSFGDTIIAAALHLFGFLVLTVGLIEGVLALIRKIRNRKKD